MNLPAPFQLVLTQLEQRSKGKTKVINAQWTTSLKRHLGAVLETNNGLRFAKLGLANQPDFDEPNIGSGMRREIWWSQTIHQISKSGFVLPFSTPLIFEHNGDELNAEVVWMIAEFIDGKPMINWEPEWSRRELSPTEESLVNNFLDRAVLSLHALEKINPQMLRKLGLSSLPSLPHGSRYYHKRGMIQEEISVLGNGAFDVEHFWLNQNGQLMLIDGEFAGWYPKYDHLAYFYQRLACNLMQPKIAKLALAKYMDMALPFTNSKKTFLAQFAELLQSHLVTGLLHDTTRRKIPPWHRKQRLRYELLWTICCGNHQMF